MTADQLCAGLTEEALGVAPLGSAGSIPAQRAPTPGDVYQINEKHGRAGWVGAFVLATEIKPWGIQGFVHVVETHDVQASAYIRLPWDSIDYVGRASLVPGGSV